MVATLVLGRINGLYGVRGWVKIYSYTHPRQNILNYAEWILQDSRGEQQYRRLLQGQQHGKGVIARLEGCDDRDSAAKLIQCDIRVAAAALPPIAEGEYYWHQLIGLEVVTVKGEALGRVDYLLETGANDVLVIKDGRGGELLIPYLPEQVITAIDLELNRLEVDWELDAD
ncbi:ribosome maturation factor RimM [Ectothiorhodospiraceae bacterium BW-2]|nr:ribosome maturation factor RimM [Ectothiorhodospiraceae bacterium BW-2]